MSRFGKILSSALKPAALLFGLAVSTMAATPTAAMNFARTTAGPECAQRVCVLASGEIEPDSAAAFLAFVKAEKISTGALVVLDSAGGNVIGALGLGGKIRKAGLSTTVSKFNRERGRFERGGVCASACAYVFLGGVERSVGVGARVGVHQMYHDPYARDALSVSDAQWLTSLVASHVNRMGGDFQVVTLALRTPPYAMHWLSDRELSRLGMVTAAQGVVAAD